MVREILFIDPTISELETFLSGLRPGIETVLLSPVSDAIQQIARSLDGRGKFDAIHVVAHGAPGELQFGSGTFTRAAVDGHAADLSRIASALSPEAALLLWCCETGAGSRGRSFIEALADATGARVVAASGLIGSEARGAAWKLDEPALPPLSTRGIAAYAGLMASYDATIGTDSVTQTTGDDTVRVTATLQVDATDFFDGDAGTDTIVVGVAGSGTSIDLSVAGTDATHGFHSYEGITFAATSGTATATFNAAQFGSGLIANSATITGNTGNQAIVVNNSSTFSAAGWTFVGWTSGTDTISISGTGGGDTLTGSSQADSINGQSGADAIDGGAGNDSITGQAGVDTLTGGLGADTFVVGAIGHLAAGETIDGTAEAGTIDTLQLDDAGTYNLAAFDIANIDSIVLSENSAGFNIAVGDALASTADENGDGATGDLRFSADISIAQPVTIDASGLTVSNRIVVNGANLAGADIITGGAGADTFNGFSGADTIDGRAGSDVIALTGTSSGLNGATDAQIVDIETVSGAGAGSPLIINLGNQTEGFTILGTNAVGAANSGDTLTGGSGNDIIDGGNGNDTINGGGGADTITGGAGLDIITGGAGADVMSGGSGDDNFIVGSLADFAGDVIDGGDGTGDELQLNQAGTYDFSSYDITSVEAIELNQNAAGWNFVLTTDFVSTAQEGGGGFGTVGISSSVALTNDVKVDGSAVAGSNRISVLGTNFGGNDTFLGTEYHDIVRLGGGNDVFTGGKGLDSLDGGAGNDTFYMAGGDLDNTVSGFESITGGADTDTIRLTSAATLDFATDAAISGVEIFNGSSGDDSIRLTATQLAGFTTVDLAGGTNTLNTVASGNISASSLPAISNVATGNLVGSTGTDTVTLTGAQLDAMLIGAGTIDLGAGTGDTVTLTTTSAELNTLGSTDAAIQGVEAFALSGAATIGLSGQTEAFTITGSGGVDIISGGSAGDTINAGGGNDTINGFVGADDVDGGAGTDTIVLTATSADLNSATNGRITTIEAVSAATAAAGVVIDLGAQTEGFTITGSGFGDSIAATAAADTIVAGAGDDTVHGFVGSDNVDGGAGTGDRIVLLATSSDLNSADNARIVNVEVISAAAASAGVKIDLSAQSEDFTVTGSAWGDTIAGSAGSDAMDAGDGVDTAVYSGNRADYVVDVSGATYTVTGPHGTDTLTNFENFQFADGTFAAAEVGQDLPTGGVAVTGSATEDQVLTADTATLADADGLGTLNYRWQRDAGAGFVDVGGNQPTYTLGDADVGTRIRVVVSYTDGNGTAESVTSAATAPIANVDDAPTGGVGITGTATEGQVLTADTATLADADGLGTLSYQWQRDAGAGFVDVGGNQPTYTLGDADVGATIRVVVSYTDSNGTAESVTSAATAPIANVDDAPTGGVAIAGTATEGQVLTADTATLADADGLGTLSYHWQRDAGAGFVDVGGNQATYALGDADVGATIRVIVSYTDGNGTAESVTSAATAPIANVDDAPTGGVAIAGTATEGQVLTADTATLADADGLGTLSYQWQRDAGAGFVDVGGNQATYALGDADVGATIRVIVSYTDGNGTAESVTSAATAPIANVDDAPTGGVGIAGTATEGQVLTADTATLADADGLGALSYRWQRDTGAGFADVGGNQSTYILGDADVGARIRVVVSYIDGEGTAESVTSAVTAPIANVDDAPTGGVGITGTATEGQVLTADTATLADADGLGTLSYRWQRDAGSGFVDVGGNQSTYTLDDADVGARIRVVVSYTDGQGTAESVTSAVTAPIANVDDAPTGGVAITGTAAEGQVLTADTATLADADGLGALSYRWQRDTGAGFADVGGNQSTYALGDADVGTRIRVVVSYTDGNGTAESVTSAATAPIANVDDAPTGGVAIAGTATEGQVLTADTATLADADGLSTLSYQWQRDTGSGFVDVGANQPTYALGDADVGTRIRVVVSYTDGNGTAESVTSAATAPIANVDDAPTGGVAIAGTATEGQVLTADTATLADADGLGTLSYRWQRDAGSGFVDVGANQPTYALGDADVGTRIRVVVSYTDGQGTAESVTSAATAAIANVNDAPVATIEPTSYSANGMLVLKGTGLSIGDIDAGTGSMTVTLTVGEGTLTATAGDSGATVSGSGTSSLTITGTVAQINSFLGAASSSTLTYAASSTPSPGTVLTLTVNDNGNTGGGNLSGSDTAMIDIAASPNQAPVISSDGGGAMARKSIYENLILVTGVKAADSDGDSLTYAIVGGADDDKFTIDAITGALAFVAAPDHERPGDTGTNNIYDVVVEVSDGRGGTDTQAIAVRVVDTSPEVILGDNGDNTFFASGGIEIFAGLRGNDTVSYASARSGVMASLGNSLSNRGEATLDLYLDIENLTGSQFDDRLTGNSGDNVLQGGAGNDVLIGGSNGAGGDTASYANATAGVTVKLATASAQNTVGAGKDTLSGLENVTGSVFGDRLTGTTGNNVLIGLAGDDELNGEAGADTLVGGAGFDTLTGGSGADAFAFGFATEGIDTVRDFVSGTDLLQISAGGFGNGLLADSAVTLATAADYATASTSGTNGAFIFDNAGADAGTVFWDANGGSGADAVALVKLLGVTSLLASDFHVV